MAKFMVGTTDFSSRVVADGSYNVFWKAQTESWIDANGTEHRPVLNHKIRGELDLKFLNSEEYESFLSAIEANRRTDSSIPITVSVNDVSAASSEKTGYCFLEYEPTRTKNLMEQDEMLQFTLSIEEQ